MWTLSAHSLLGGKSIRKVKVQLLDGRHDSKDRHDKQSPWRFSDPQKMNAVRLHKADGPAGLVYEQMAIPQPKAGEALIRVHAAAITRHELDWPVNRLPAIPSYEFSGVVTAMGRGSDGVTIDDVYNHKRIHSALGYLTPSEFAGGWALRAA